MWQAVQQQISSSLGSKIRPANGNTAAGTQWQYKAAQYNNKPEVSDQYRTPGRKQQVLKVNKKYCGKNVICA